LNKLFTDSKVLETVEEVSIRKPDLKLLNSILALMVEVEPHVVKPCEIIDVGGSLVYQKASRFSLMNQISDKLLIFLSDVLLKVLEDSIS